MKTKRSTYTIDYKKWRSGSETSNQVGIGDTELINEEGYMCCLGQICRQINPTLNLLHITTPVVLGEKIPHLTDTYRNNYINSPLSLQAVSINDAEKEIYMRIYKLKNLFHKNGITLRFINVPKHIKVSVDKLMRRRNLAL